MIKMELMLGRSIYHIAETAVQIAQKNRDLVELPFNGITVQVHPCSHPDDIAEIAILKMRLKALDKKP